MSDAVPYKLDYENQMRLKTHCRSSQREVLKMYDTKICSECGKEFTPRQGKQLTCSRECSVIRNRNRVRDNYKKYGHKTEPKRCTICGEIIDFTKCDLKRYATMHEECVIKDLMDTVKTGKKLSETQYSRMSARGISTKDLILMIGRERREKNMRDMW